MDKKPKLNPSQLTPDQRDKLDKWNQDKQKIQLLSDIADMNQDVLSSLDSASKGNQDSLKKMGVLLVEMKGFLSKISKQEAPESPDYAKPVVEALSKVEKTLNSSLKAIDIKPQVNVDAPKVNVTPPNIDLKGVEKALKTDMPKAFKEALALIPKPEKPDFKPLLSAWEGISEQLESIENATRAKPLPGSMKVTNPDGSVIGGSSGITGTLSNVTMTGSSVTLQASNTSRSNLMIFNDSGVVVYVKLGSTASSTSFTVKMVDQSYYELPTPVYTGIVTALGASGSVRVTEVA